MLGGEDDGPAPGAVDVQPDVVLLADGGEGREGVEGAKDRGAGCGVEEEGGFASLFTFDYEALEFGGNHAPLVIDGDADDVRTAQAVEVGGFFDGVVPVGGGEDG